MEQRMNKTLQELHDHLDFISTDCGPHDITINILFRMVDSIDGLIPVVKNLYENESNHRPKEILAMMLIHAGEVEPYKSYLKEQHDWEDQDF